MSCVGPGGGRSAGLAVARVPAGEDADEGAHGCRLAGGQVAPARVELLVAGSLGGPVARECLEEVLARPWPEVEDGSPDVMRTRLARRPDRLGELLRPVGEAGQNRRHGDIRADTRVDEPSHDLEPLARRRRTRLGRAPDPVVQRRHRNVDGHLCPLCSLLEHIDIAPHEWPARDDRGRGARPRELDDARPGEAVAPFGRLVRVGRGSDRHLLARPRSAGELGTEDVGNVELDANRAPVAIVRGTIGPLLEGADVTERAAVDAAGVRVQRPGEWHSLDAVQRRAARLLAVLDGHEPL